MAPKADQALYKGAGTIRNMCSRRDIGVYPLPMVPAKCTLRMINARGDLPRNPGTKLPAVGDLQQKKGMKMEKVIIQLAGSVRSNKAIALKDQPTQKDKSEEK